MPEPTHHSSDESHSDRDSRSDSKPASVATWIPVTGFATAAAIFVAILAAGSSSSDPMSTGPPPQPVSIDQSQRSENAESDASDPDRSGQRHTAVSVSMADMI